VVAAPDAGSADASISKEKFDLQGLDFRFQGLRPHFFASAVDIIAGAPAEPIVSFGLQY
jgi:hypothetical protein